MNVERRWRRSCPCCVRWWRRWWPRWPRRLHRSRRARARARRERVQSSRDAALRQRHRRADGRRRLSHDRGRRRHVPPAPWVNVIANPHGGFIVSERGTGCTWAENSVLLPADPVAQRSGRAIPASDVLYLRRRHRGSLECDAGARSRAMRALSAFDTPPGSTTFDHDHDGIHSELTARHAGGRRRQDLGAAHSQ